jgi:hypothetical protein
MSRKKVTLLKSQVTWRLPTVVVVQLSSLAVKKGEAQHRRVNESEILTDLVASNDPKVLAQLIEEGYDYRPI